MTTFDYIVTRSGKRIHFDSDTPAHQFCIDDIFDTLCNIPRWAGHSHMGFSVGQHSALVTALALRDNQSPLTMLQCLMHDASEAYMGDIATPLKSLLPGYKAIEMKISNDIHRAFNIPFSHTSYKKYDQQALYLEAQYLFPYCPRNPQDFGLDEWPPAQLTAQEVSEFLHVTSSDLKGQYALLKYEYEKDAKESACKEALVGV